ncbi:MAG: hypothetical protein J6K26_02100, partial [Lachnospiraceae bacterium]|nr:hypothetical protein [Lachnospiraceae bacterium]
FIDTFIDKIFATPEGDGTMRLDIKIFTGESCEKYLQKLKRRADPEGRLNWKTDFQFAKVNTCS